MKHALLQMHLAVLLWGFTGVLGRAIALDAPVLVWYRMGLTAIFVFIIIASRRLNWHVTRTDFFRMGLIGWLMALHWVAFFGAIKLANASIALVCLSTAGIFTSLADAILNKKKLIPQEIGIGLMALLGVFIMYALPLVFPFLYAQQSMVLQSMPHRDLGILCGVTAAILSSIFTVLNKRLTPAYPSRVLVFYEMGTGWLFITLLLPFLMFSSPEMDWFPSATDWVWLAVLSLCCTVWAQSLALHALRIISSFTATLSVNLEPIYGMILAFIFYQENQELSWAFYVGLFFILLSVGLQMLLLKQKKLA